MLDGRSDRRRFLASSTALLMSDLIGEASRGNSDTDELPAVRVAVVGTGARGSDLIRALSTIERVRLVAICDDYAPHLESARTYADSACRTYADYSAMLRETRPEAVVVATPLNRHQAMCLQALDAGCAVFCEKMMCFSLDEARELVSAVEARHAVFQVGLQRRANAIYRQAAAMVQSGMLGSISAIKCQWHRHNNWRRPVPVARNDPRYDTLERRLNWRLYRESSRGLMAELASHQLDIATWLLGTTPRRAIGSGGIDYWCDGREVFDNVFCIYDYDSRSGPEGATHSTVRVTYSSIQNNAYEGSSELVMGTRGTLFLTPRKGLFFREQGVEEAGWSRDENQEHNAALVTSGKTLRMTNDPWSHRGKPFEIDAHGDETRDELISFLDHVGRHDTDTLCTARDGLINTATVLIGDEAIRESRAVEFPGDLP